ncbi:guanylate kinase [Paenibacillus thermoaerophilus]|uniref:Guanylate kinase n=1 Tax=Paenibacillus thermoaerophilus TaxID=1215385 RepID=A0ABW2UXX0_9BACL|nr:guanylate kinase [Paenibacillus thermoaerophilus]TMV19147.1 guanylate kinase [Paenibacillus thermoaerophilus]
MTNNPQEPGRKGLLIVLSGPAGVGKGTVCSHLRRISPDLVYSVSATTRAPRQGEQEGINYFFKSREQFQAMIDNDELLEWAQYVGNFYGTPRSFVEDMIASGRDVILEIEVQGALQVKNKYPQGVFVFLMPPSLDELKMRITGRGTETEDVIEKRMNVAIEELRMMRHYHYVVTNDEVESACERIRSIIAAEHCKRERLEPYLNKWLEGVTG